MILTAIDLEMAQPSGKIISLGYCIGDTNTGDILASNDVFVKIDEPLTPFIIELTGITEETLATKGGTLLEAYETIKRDHILHKSFVNTLTWGGGDTEALRTQLNKDREKWLFGRRWIDVKTLYISRCIAKSKPFKGGLVKSMRSMGLEFEGKVHSSMSDAINTFKFYCHLLKEFK